jgi:farnesyl-diphosphate farnesyltransferase
MTDLDDLLAKTSRTFALTIPLLPQPIRHEVGLAYLLFRVIDTFEDATHWLPRRRIEALEQFVELVEAPDPARARQLAHDSVQDPPLDHAGYLQLLGEIPLVLGQLHALRPGSRQLLQAHVMRSAHGMMGVIARAADAGQVELLTVSDLRDYCYIVAGIVGEMLTELFLLDRPGLADIAGFLRERAQAFGEGLQLVNILKDAATDAREGRIYVPAAVNPAEVFALARNDLRAAADYTLALQEHGAERGLVAFNALLVRMAMGTLLAIRDGRPAGKLSRVEVFGLFSAVLRDLDAGLPVLPRSASLGGVSAAV